MSKKYILFLFVVIFFSGFHLAQAEVVINEVQISPTLERFLELYNTGDSAVDLTNWYIQRKTATGSSFGSFVSKTNFEGKTISAHGYFVISKNSFSNSDIVLDSLTLTESNTIQIKNSNEEVVDKVGWGSASDCGNPCPPNPPEGQSIQKTGTGSWISSTPTPGASNQAPASNSNNTNDSNTANTNNTNNNSNTNTDTNNDSNTNTSVTNCSGCGGGILSSSSSSPKVEDQKIKVKIIGKTLAFIGIPLGIQAQVSGTSGEQFYGKYFWNFGDGDSKETRDSLPFSHSYFYAGEYPVSVEYYANFYSDTPDATAKIIIKVVPMIVSISKVGDVNDFFIELWNSTDYEIDISKWVLSSVDASLDKKFTLPKNTVLLAKKKMVLSPQITNFTLADAKNLKLSTSEGQLVFDYGASIFPVKEEASEPVADVSLSTKTEDKITKKVSISRNNIPVKKDSTPALALPEIPIQNLGASVASSEAVKGNPISYASVIVAVLFIGASAGAVYFIRQKRVISNAGDDFKILDE